MDNGGNMADKEFEEALEKEAKEYISPVTRAIFKEGANFVKELMEEREKILLDALKIYAEKNCLDVLHPSDIARKALRKHKELKNE